MMQSHLGLRLMIKSGWKVVNATNYLFILVLLLIRVQAESKQNKIGAIRWLIKSPTQIGKRFAIPNEWKSYANSKWLEGAHYSTMWLQVLSHVINKSNIYEKNWISQKKIIIRNK